MLSDAFLVLSWKLLDVLESFWMFWDAFGSLCMLLKGLDVFASSYCRSSLLCCLLDVAPKKERLKTCVAVANDNTFQQ